MAARKNNNKKTQSSKLMVIFWLSFFVIIISIFFINLPTIKKNFNVFMTRLTAPAGTIIDDDFLGDLKDEAEVEIVEEPIVSEPQIVSVTEKPEFPPEKPVTPPAATPSVTPVTPKTPTVTPTPPPRQQPTVVTPPEPPPVQMRDRAVYFTQVNNDGQILQSRVTRRIPASQSPMQDALNLLLTGPSADELKRGIINLIPQNTRVLSATVRGSTAYISFSEDFLFNTFGVEGYVAQLRQIIWTVTEFSNVSDVQILIEGRRLDYLGEGIWIGSPIGRQSF